MDFFYDKKCSIYSITKAKVDGSESYVETPLYTEILCDFWLGSWNNTDSKLSRDTKELYYTVDLQPSYTDVRKWMRIQLFDIVNGSSIDLWMFEIVSVEYFKNLDNLVDNIRLKVYPRNV